MDKIEVEIQSIRNYFDRQDLKKEQNARKPTKIQNLKDEVDQVVFSNIQGLVDPNSNGAKLAHQRI